MIVWNMSEKAGLYYSNISTTALHTRIHTRKPSHGCVNEAIPPPASLLHVYVSTLRANACALAHTYEDAELPRTSVATTARWSEQPPGSGPSGAGRVS